MGKWQLFAASALAAGSALAQASDFDRGMNTLWEVLWHQAGTPTRLVRWEQPMRVRIHGVNVAAHKAHTLQALREVAKVAGVPLTDVSDQAGAPANVDIEIVANDRMAEDQPCETRLNYPTETVIRSVTMQMRDSDARRCAFHEAMHVMGVRGHPEGETVLSYFSAPVDGLMPLDRAMLRAWYSPRTQAGMTPFELLPILGDELVAILPDRAAAQRDRDRFLARTVDEMRAFAEGRADVPAIVRKSGKASEAGVRFGRMEMSYFLGIAYEEGAAVNRDAAEAARWMQRAATLGNRAARSRVGAAG